MNERTARTTRRLSQLGHRVAEADPHRPAGERDELTDRLATIDHHVSRLTEAIENFRGNALNHVLFSGTGQIPATGETWWTLQTQVDFARIVVLPITYDVRVEAAPPRDAGASIAPLRGRGMLWFPASAGRVEFPLTGNIITVYGTPGALFDLALITKAPA